MATTKISIKNISSELLFLKELYLSIRPFEILQLDQQFDFFQLAASRDLKQQIEDEKISIVRDNVELDATQSLEFITTPEGVIVTQADLDKINFITITQSVDLDQLESDVNTNNSTLSFLTITQPVDLDQLEIDVTANSSILSFLTLTQPVNLDQLEIDVAANSSILSFLTLTQPVDLDQLETDFYAFTGTNVGSGKGVFKQKFDNALEFKSLVGGSNVAITSNANDLTIDFSGTITEANVVNVLTAGDLPSTLAANTAYIINGSISTSTAITSVGDNAIILGRKGRDCDILTYTGTGPFISFTDVNFTLRNITLKSTNSSSTILNGSNYTAGQYNEGRNKVLSIFTCQFRNCYDVMDINGFDLVDINNSLFFYVQATNYGCRFHSVSKLEFSSCELIRWFDETSLPTPSGYATVPMIEIVANGVQVGLGAVNINGCIIHPQQTQDGIFIDNGSTTGFGTIASNTFVDVGLTTGLTANLDYNIQNSYIIQANQKVENGNAKGLLSLTGNLIELDNSSAAGPPYSVVLADANFVGGAGPTNPVTFPVARRVITSSSNASFEYNSKVNGNFFVALNATVGVNANGTFTITVQFRQNGTPLPIVGKTTIRNSGGNFIAQPVSLTVQGDATQGDVFDVLVSCDTANDVLVSELIINGIQL